VYANVLNKPVLVPSGVPTSLGSGIMALLAAGVYPTIETAQEAVCLPLRTVQPEPEAAKVYEQLYTLYRSVYFALGHKNAEPIALGKILPELRRIAAEVQR
ncbi:MAG TPA: ribulokinase, partial [Acidobacteriaceae bacterium]